MGMYSGFTREKSDLRNKDVEITKEPFTILIMGIEDYATDGQNGRTDSLMFATVNPKTQKISLMSIPRDSRVKIVGKNKEDKIKRPCLRRRRNGNQNCRRLSKSSCRPLSEN